MINLGKDSSGILGPHTPSQVWMGVPQPPQPGLDAGGYPIPDLEGVPHHRSGQGGTPSQVWTGGYPITGLDRGVSHPRSGWGGTPSQVWMVGVPHPRSGWGYLGYPQPGLDGEGYPITGLDRGVPPSQVWMGRYPIPGLDGGEYPIPGLDGGGTPSQVWTGGTLGYPPPGLVGYSSPPPSLDRAA